MKSFFRYIALGAILSGLSGCATAGRQFEFSGPESITPGKTTKAEILSQYGEPFRVGYDNGTLKWTYGYYKYRVFGQTDTKDLVVSFDRSGSVKDYTYSTSLEEEKRRILSEKK